MTSVALLILLAVAALVSAALLAGVSVVLRRRWLIPRTGSDLALVTLVWISIAGAIGVLWLMAETLRYDGWMDTEFELGAGLITLLAGATGGAWALRRRGWRAAALVTAALGAVPTTVMFAFLLYLNSHPIDMR